MNEDIDGLLGEAYIVKLILENFQSHAYNEFDFSRGFNIFVGESKQGKSAVLRACNLLFNNKPSGRRYIKKGADYAKVTAHLSNGFIVSRYVEAKKTGKNGYFITDPKTGETSYHNTKILPEIQKILGYTVLNIDKDLQVDLNFSKQGTGWFLIGEQYSAPQKAKIIGGIYGTQYADAVLRDLEAEDKRLNDKTKLANESLSKTDSEILKYNFMPDLEGSIAEIELEFKEIEKLKNKSDKIISLLEKRERLSSQITENTLILDKLAKISEANKIMISVNNDISRKKELERLVKDHSKLSNSLFHIEKTLKATVNISVAVKHFVELNEMISRKTKIEKLVNKHSEINTNVNKQNEVLAKTKHINDAKLIINEISSLSKQSENIKNSIEKREIIIEQINHQDKIITLTADVDKAKDSLALINQNIISLNELKSKVEQAEKLETKKKNIEKSLKAIDKSLKETINIESARKSFDEVQKLIGRKDTLAIVLKNRNKISESIQNEDSIIKENTGKIEQDIKTYQSILSKSGKCPVCFGTIDKATVNRIVQEYTK